MILLDENIRKDQIEQLHAWGIPGRDLTADWAPSGIQDDDILRLLHHLKRPTLFTHDRDYFRAERSHPAYCLVWLDLSCLFPHV